MSQRQIRRMGREEYRHWAMSQPRGRFERIDGEVVAMAPERIAHVRTKYSVWQALDRAIRASGVPCEAIGDGATVEVGEDIDYEPDAIVNCGERLAGDVTVASSPAVIVEVLSPSTASIDTGAKLADYFRLPTLHHYLIVRADRREVTHHRRADPGAATIETRVLTEGPIVLDPPGITVDLAEFYPEPD